MRIGIAPLDSIKEASERIKLRWSSEINSGRGRVPIWRTEATYRSYSSSIGIGRRMRSSRSEYPREVALIVGSGGSGSARASPMLE